MEWFVSAVQCSELGGEFCHVPPLLEAGGQGVPGQARCLYFSCCGAEVDRRGVETCLAQSSLSAQESG